MFCMQSLADIARQEMERRRLLDEQGIEAKIIDPDTAAQSSRNGNLTISTTGTSPGKKTSNESTSTKERKSVRTFSTALQKLDRTIRQNEGLLQSKRARLQSQRWEMRRSSSGKQLQQEIEELEMKLEQLQRERSEVFQAGKKAGFLPGELDGKGIVP